MVNETMQRISSCFGIEMAVSIHRDAKLTAAHVAFRKQKTSFPLIWLNCTFHILLSAVTIFYNVKILTNGIKRQKKWTFSTMVLFNLAVADAMVGFVIPRSHAALSQLCC